MAGRLKSNVSYDIFGAESFAARHTPKAHGKSHVCHLDGPLASPPASVNSRGSYGSYPIGAPVLRKGQCLYVRSSSGNSFNL